MPPFVSIIVPCYNEETTIRHLLDSVLAQTYPRAQMELIISDGLSTDHTREVIAAEDVNARLVELGALPAANTPAQFGALIDKDRARYAKIIQERGISVD